MAVILRTMNRKQRRAKQFTSSSAGTKKLALSGLTATGLVASSLGLAAPANAAAIDSTVTSCADFISALPSLESDGGVLTANFTGTCSITSPISFDAASTIIGPVTGELKLVKNFHSSTPFIQAPHDFTLRNVTLENGLQDTGSLLFVQPSGSFPTITLSHDSFRGANNDLGNGGAIWVEGHVEIDHSNFFNNTARWGGAIFVTTGGSDLTISNSTFESNVSSSDRGGAIYSEADIVVTIEDSAFNSNDSAGFGGAIFSEGSVWADRSTFFDNHAQLSGGAIASPNGSTDLSNDTFVENSANDAGALWSEGGKVANSTFWNNSNVDPSAATITTNGAYFFANILAGSNNSHLVGTSYTDAGANLYTDDSFTPTTTGAGASKRVILASLKLKALALNRTAPRNSGFAKTMAIGADSVAHDYFTSTSPGLMPTIMQQQGFTSEVDERGVERPINGKYDVGAFEAAVPVPTPTPKPAVTHKTILFKGNSSKLTNHAKAQLRALAASVQANGVHKITLDGHTATLTKADPSGRKYRGILAGARTRAVEKYLKKQFKKTGYSVTITRVIKGAATPAKSNRTEKGRKANRRVYVTVQ